MIRHGITVVLLGRRTPHENPAVEALYWTDFWGRTYWIGMTIGFLLLLYPGTRIIRHVTGLDEVPAPAEMIIDGRVIFLHPADAGTLRTVDSELDPTRCDLLID